MTVIELYNALAGMPSDADVVFVNNMGETEPVCAVELHEVPAGRYHVEFQEVVLS